MLQRSRAEGPFGQPIYDEDGDGIEDNMKFNSDDLDKFYKPNRFFPTEHIYNTRHGGLPGQRQKYFFDSQKEQEDEWRLVKKDWKKW